MHQLVDLVDRLTLGVQPVELHVLVGAVDVALLLLELGRPRRLLAPERQCLQGTLAGLGDGLGSLQLLLHLAAGGEHPLGNVDRLSLGVVQRVFAEPLTNVVDQQLVAKRVDATAGDVCDAGRVLGTDGGDRDDGGDHDVDGDDVDRAFGDARELLQQPAGVAEDHRFGHAEAADPTGERFGERALDDRRSHDRDRHCALGLGERLLAECLGVRVGIGPADARGSRSSGLHQLIAHPAFAELLGLAGQRGSACRSELGLGLLAHLAQMIRVTTRSFEVAAQPAGCSHLLAPVEPQVERAFADQLLGGRSATVTGDVAGADGHQVRCDAEVVERLGDAHRPEQVDLDRRVEG